MTCPGSRPTPTRALHAGRADEGTADRAIVAVRTDPGRRHHRTARGGRRRPRRRTWCRPCRPARLGSREPLLAEHHQRVGVAHRLRQRVRRSGRVGRHQLVERVDQRWRSHRDPRTHRGDRRRAWGRRGRSEPRARRPRRSRTVRRRPAPATPAPRSPKSSGVRVFATSSSVCSCSGYSVSRWRVRARAPRRAPR